jgi:hypothetical protein
MARTVRVEIDKLKGIQNVVGLILKESVNAPIGKESLGTAEQIDLTEREKAILEYIKRNPGKIKEQVVDYFVDVRKQYSRAPILDSIESLAKLEIILVKKEHRQKHFVYPNEESLLISEFRDLEQFKESFLRVLKKARREYDNLYAKKQRTKIDDDPSLVLKLDNYKSYIVILVYYLLRHMINTYGVIALFRWPSMTKNKEILNRLYIGVFARLSEILSASLEFLPTEKDPRIVFDNIMTENYSHIYDFESVIDNSKEYGLYKEFEPVMDCIWRIRSNNLASVPYDPDRTKRTAQDWRELLKEYKETSESEKINTGNRVKSKP